MQTRGNKHRAPMLINVFSAAAATCSGAMLWVPCATQKSPLLLSSSIHPSSTLLPACHHSAPLTCAARLSYVRHQVRQRCEDLRRSLDEVIRGLSSSAVGSLQWHHVLDKASVINVQLAGLMAQLRPLMRDYVVTPRGAVDAPGLAAGAVRRAASLRAPPSAPAVAA